MSGRIERLVKRYRQFCELPWERSVAGPQRVWFVVYDKGDERRLRARLDEFEVATKAAGHSWRHVDLIDAFGCWLAAQEYRESYFESPEDLDLLLPEFERSVTDLIAGELSRDGVDQDAVVAVSGVAGLFGFVKVSSVVETVASKVSGRLVVFFPGEHEDNNYRLLDARDGWNYMAIPIKAHDGAEV